MSLFAAQAHAPSHAEILRVAAATNFAPVMEALAQDFGRDVQVISGASGTLAAQIRQGAPYDLFLSADTARPAALVAAGIAHGQTPYAYGRLVLWSPATASLRDQASARQLLESLRPRQLALANPALAPYGAAALEALTALGLSVEQPVLGQNIGQAYALVATGNAVAGFVAGSQVQGVKGGLWPVPGQLHGPIQQDMVLLTDKQDAQALYGFLISGPAQAVIVAAGYAVPDGP